MTPPAAASRARRPPRAAAPLDASTSRIVDDIRRLERALRLAARRVESTTALSAAQLFVLEQLAVAPAESLSALAERTLTDRTSVSAVVDRLARRKLVERRPGRDDRRRAAIRITPAGRRVLTAAPTPPTARLLDALERLSTRDRTALATGLGRLNTALGLAGVRPGLLFAEGGVQ